MKYILPVLVASVIGFGVGWLYVQSAHKDIKSTLVQQLEEQRGALVTLAETTNRNGGNDSVATFVRDCTPGNRDKFDRSLDELATLGTAALNETQLLFDACASFFAEQKAAMVWELEHEYARMQELLEFAVLVDGDAPEDFNQEDWERYISLETQRAELLAERVTIQNEIITSLQAGESINGETIRSKTTRAQEIAKFGAVLQQQIDALLSDLT